MDGQHLELRGWEGNTLTLEQAKQAGRNAAWKAWNHRLDYCESACDAHLADAYQALELYVTLEGAEGMAPHTLLADAFCDAYDEEIELQARRFER